MLSSGRAPGATLTAAPILGVDAPASTGWTPYLITVSGEDDGARGSVELSDGSGEKSRASVAVAPRESLHVELPFRDAFGKGLEAILRDDTGHVIAKASLPSPPSQVPLLFDLGRTGRLESALRTMRVPVRSNLGAWLAASGLELAVTHAAFDPRSGEPELPRRGLGYGSVTVAFAESDDVEALDATDFSVLDDWVAGGGTLALAVAHPEDLTRPRLAALTGGPVAIVPAKTLAGFDDFEVVEDTSPTSPPPTTYVVRHVAPREDVAARLVEFHGGAVRATRFGASAAHGLGQVALLGFDPTAAAFVDDDWVRLTMVELVRDGWDRKSSSLYALGYQGPGENRLDSVRRVLDPNEGNRWAIAVAAALLVAYAVIALPLTFRRAKRQNRPLRALVELPLWAFSTMAAIVVVGAIAKGGRSRARRIALVESGSDARRAAVVRFRGFFASSAKFLRVESLGPSSLLDVDSTSVPRTLVLDREKARLEDLQGRPWETLLVREDGFVDLDGSVHVGGGVITNHLDHALVRVVVGAPGEGLRYFPRIDAGETAHIDAGRALGVPVAPPVPAALPMPVTVPVPKASALTTHQFETYRFAAELDRDAPGTSAVWSAFEASAPNSVDYWPSDKAALIAEVDQGDTATTDSGLAIDHARLFIRVVGNREEP